MRFDGAVEQRDRGLVVQLPFDPKEAFGRVRAPVVVTVNDHSFRTTTMRYGEVDLIGLNREVRDAAGLSAGARVTFDVTADTQPREVEVPETLAAALREETRERRVARAVELLLAGVRTPDSARR